MTNRIAFIVFVLIGLGIVADVMLNDSKALLFMGKKLFDAIEWLAFWR